MELLRQGSVGILPAGALGVAFFYHLTRELERVSGDVSFIERSGSPSGQALRAAAVLRIQTDARVRTIEAASIWRPDLLACFDEGLLPELLLVCTQPNQMLHVLNTYVLLIERLYAQPTLGAPLASLPALILCSNGIYFQRTRQFLLERLEEATLLGRLPDLWPDGMPAIVGKFLRGVTIQTGQRDGIGSEAIYRPGPRGRTRLAGGAPEVRARCATLLSSLGGWFEMAAHPSPTRAEFDKALVNLTVNLLGQLTAIDERGVFRPLTVGEILEGPLRNEARLLAEHVVRVGRAVHAYSAEDDFEAIFEATLVSCREHLDHVPSSVQWIDQQLRAGKLQPRLSPTEAWLLEPLIRYAHAAGLEDAAHFFEALTRRLEQRLSLAIAHAASRSSPAQPVHS